MSPIPPVFGSHTLKKHKYPCCRVIFCHGIDASFGFKEGELNKRCLKCFQLETFLPFDIDNISPSVTTIWINAFSHAVSSWRKPVLCGIFVKWSFLSPSFCILKNFYSCLFSFVFIFSLVHVGLFLLQYWISAQICRFFYYRFHKILIIEYLYTSFKMYPRRCFQITSTINFRLYNFLSSVSSSFFRL